MTQPPQDPMRSGLTAYFDAHQFPDTDNSPSSIHHTLGGSPNQAAPGNHAHDWPGDLHVTLNPDPPPGCVFLDGTLMYEEEAPLLYGLWGRDYGGSALNGTFATPDLSDALPVGAIDPAVPGAFLGAGQLHSGHAHSLNNHTHTDPQHQHTSPQHQHTSPQHAHGLNNHVHATAIHYHGLNNHQHSSPIHNHGLAAHTHAAGTLTIEDTTLTQQSNTGLGGTAGRLTGPATHAHNITGSTLDGGGGAVSQDNIAANTGAAVGSTEANAASNTGVPSIANSEQNAAADTGLSAAANTGLSAAANTGASVGNTGSASGDSTGHLRLEVNFYVRKQ